MPLSRKALRPFLLVVLLVAAMPGAASPAPLHDALAALSRPLQSAADLGPLVDAAAAARVVLLGEATHGTHEFYTWRDRITRRLVEEDGFAFVAIEGDWASLIPLDRYVRQRPDAPASARAALQQVDRWPRWIWANAELAAFAEWLRDFNAGRAPEARVGIHGIDLYAIWHSLDAVLAVYARHRPEELDRVRGAYRLLEGFRGDYRGYSDHVRRTGADPGAAIARVVHDLAWRYHAAGPADRGRLFEALQHARVVAAGERYLRLAPGPPAWSWNVRAGHFDQTVARLLAHYGPGSRAVVWAHNTHIGDARATDMRFTGEVNLGQLARQRYGPGAVFAVGFGTATGAVMAAREWEGKRETFSIPPPRPDSIEAALLASGDGDRWLRLDPRDPATRPLLRSLPHRAIGVVFEPTREASRHYTPTRPALRYDAFVFLPRTTALRPLDVD